MNKPKPSVGQTLYKLNTGHNARHRPRVLTPVVVTQVGRKYFTVADSDNTYLETQFHLGDWSEHTEYSRSNALYSTEQEWLDEKESASILEMLQKKFSYMSGSSVKLSLEQLRAIKAILDGSTAKECEARK